MPKQSFNSSPVIPFTKITNNKDGRYRLRPDIEVRFTPHFDFSNGECAFSVWFMHGEDEVLAINELGSENKCARWVHQVLKQRNFKHLVLPVEKLFGASEPELLISAMLAEMLMEHVRLRINIAKRRVVLYFHKEGEKFEVDIGSYFLSNEGFNLIFEAVSA